MIYDGACDSFTEVSRECSGMLDSLYRFLEVFFFFQSLNWSSVSLACLAFVRNIMLPIKKGSRLPGSLLVEIDFGVRK